MDTCNHCQHRKHSGRICPIAPGMGDPCYCRSELPLTAMTEAASGGDPARAAAVHNATVHAAFERARQGVIINLTDLMASKEVLIIHADTRRVVRTFRQRNGKRVRF